jgi:hypothetical protein
MEASIRCDTWIRSRFSSRVSDSIMYMHIYAMTFAPGLNFVTSVQIAVLSGLHAIAVEAASASRSRQRDSSHANTTDDEQLDSSRQRPMSRVAGCCRRDHPTSSPQDAYTGGFQGKRLHHMSSSLNHPRV